MPRIELELNPVSHISVDAIGTPGSRVFYLQGWQESDPQPVTIIIEKIQLQSLVAGIEQFLAEVARQNPALPQASADYVEAQMRVSPPVDPLFRVGEIALAYDRERDMVLLLVREIVSEGVDSEDAAVVRFWCTRSQALAMARWGVEVANRGRPLCRQCGEPMEPGGHFCPKKNGHKKQ